MYDQFGRKISYMRISVTDRCNMRCIYCRPNSFKYIEHKDILSYEEILRVCQQAVKLGITRFKVTGGEPLVRKGCLEFLQSLKNLPGVEQVTLTSNGTMLAEHAKALANIGVDGVNISLDTCDKVRFEKITGVDGLDNTLKGIEAGFAAGLKMKLNCVPLKSTAESDFLALLNLAERYEIPLRFIELMPLKCNGQLNSYSGAEMRSMLSKMLKADISLKNDGIALGNGPAQYYNVAGYKVPLGFIEPIHGKFCSNCNRIRLTATGGLKTCLYQAEIVDMRKLLRDGSQDSDILKVLEETIFRKPQEHSFGVKFGNFAMNEIGG